MEQADTLEIMLEKLYAQWGISNDTDFDALAPTDYPILSDLHDLMQKERLSIEDKNELYTAEMLRDTAKAIYSICAGPDSIYFNGRTNIPSKRFLTFGLKDIMGCGQDVRSLMLFNLLAYTNHELLGTGNTAAIYEEFHSFTNNEAAVNLICNAMKRVRKKESQVIIASQNLEDFMRPGVAEITKPLFYIPTHQFLFYPGSVPPKDFMEMLQLDEAEYNLIRNPQTGVCLMKCGSERYNLVVRAPEYKQKLYGTGGGR